MHEIQQRTEAGGAFASRLPNAIDATTTCGKFTIGDVVSYVNDYGVKFPERTVVGIDCGDGEPRYFLAPTDAPWFAVRESSLILDADDPVVCIEGGHTIRYTDFQHERWFAIGVTRLICRTLERAREIALANPPGTPWERYAL